VARKHLKICQPGLPQCTLAQGLGGHFSRCMTQCITDSSPVRQHPVRVCELSSVECGVPGTQNRGVWNYRASPSWQRFLLCGMWNRRRRSL